MTKAISLSNISFTLPDGKILFSDISLNIQAGAGNTSALVGPNGIGKSVLARIICSEETPSSGQVSIQGKTYYMPQQWQGSIDDTIATVLGLQPALLAMERITEGSVSTEDFELAEPWWDYLTTLESVAAIIDWPHKWELQRPIGSYSGGEQIKILWASALLYKPDILVMDEPSNHLDQVARKRLKSWLQNTDLLVLIVSHDRELLDCADLILELSMMGLFRHTGNYLTYLANRKERMVQSQHAVQNARRVLGKELGDSQKAKEKQQQRASTGKVKAAREGWSAMERNGAKDAASASLQRNRRLQDDRVNLAQSKVSQVYESLEWVDPISFELPDSILPTTRKVLTLDSIQSGFKKPLHKPVTIELFGAQRLWIKGNNGIGKSLLLKTLMGQHQAMSGRAELHVKHSFLDQHNSILDPAKTAVDNFRDNCPGMLETSYRERLAWVRLRASKGDIVTGQLSGGEQLKVAIACALLGPETPQVLLLDEPTNHLDLDSIQALENALSKFRGAIILISHDQHFVDSCQITKNISLVHSTDSE